MKKPLGPSVSAPLGAGAVWICAAMLGLIGSQCLGADGARDMSTTQAMRMLDDDPGLAAKVAAANGLSTVRFMSQESPTIATMVRTYLVRRGHEEKSTSQAMQMLNDDPGLAAKVAAANGLSTVRFMSQETPTIATMLQAYLVRREHSDTTAGKVSARRERVRETTSRPEPVNSSNDALTRTQP